MLYQGPTVGTGGRVAETHERRATTSPTYFGHVVQFGADEKRQLREAICAARGGKFDRTVDQVQAISLIVHKKCRRIQIALLLFLLAAATCSAALVLNARR